MNNIAKHNMPDLELFSFKHAAVAVLAAVIPISWASADSFVIRGARVFDGQNVSLATDVQVEFDDHDPFADGWGWWLFHQPQIHDDSILFAADYLPAGTYTLTYTLVPLQAGEFRVLPAHAWESFFPEVQGTSAGAVFAIKP